jgi:hypothetical protein
MPNHPPGTLPRSVRLWAFQGNGHWLYRDSQTKRHFGRNKFQEARDAELILELKKRGFSVLGPAALSGNKSKVVE